MRNIRTPADVRAALASAGHHQLKEFAHTMIEIFCGRRFDEGEEYHAFSPIKPMMLTNARRKIISDAMASLNMACEPRQNERMLLCFVLSNLGRRFAVYAEPIIYAGTPDFWVALDSEDNRTYSAYRKRFSVDEAQPGAASDELELRTAVPGMLHGPAVSGEEVIPAEDFSRIRKHLREYERCLEAWHGPDIACAGIDDIGIGRVLVGTIGLDGGDVRFWPGWHRVEAIVLESTGPVVMCGSTCIRIRNDVQYLIKTRPTK